MTSEFINSVRINSNTARLRKTFFIVQAETDVDFNDLVAGDTCFSYGGGVPSTPNFGLYIPFQATIVKWSYISTATGTARFNLVNYDASGSAVQRFPLDFTSPRTYSEVPVVLLSDNNLVLEFDRLEGEFDPSARHHIMLWLR